MSQLIIFVKSQLGNILILTLLSLFLLNRGPGIYNQFKIQGQLAADFEVAGVKGEKFHLKNNQKQILVFWATWCVPCKIEMNRINKMIEQNEVSKDLFLAISVGEEWNVVNEFISREKFLFPVALDQSGVVANFYSVKGTPTIVFIDENNQIEWMTMGISPSLSFRIKKFAN